MAQQEKAEQKAQAQPAQDTDADRKAFRREAAMALAAAYVTRHGGFGVPVLQEGAVRQIWHFADLLVSMENAGPEKPNEDGPAQPKRRPVHPNDEFGVVFEDGKRRGGFMTEEAAEDFARGKPGARVVQIAGPGVDSVRVAASTV